MTRLDTAAQREETARRYFDGQTAGDVEIVASCFEDDATLFNVNNPPIQGIRGIRAFCEYLYYRTEKREFTVLSVATGQDCVMVEWEVDFEFREGTTAGGVTATKPVTTTLRGISKFEFGDGSRVQALRIHHETSSVAEAYRQQAS